MTAETHSLFVVGRIVKGEQRLVFVRNAAPAPFPGPWDLRAVIVN